jgi:hypothetical protein
MPTKQIALVFLVLLILATTAAGWKWDSGHAHKSAGWTWDDGTSHYAWVD